MLYSFLLLVRGRVPKGPKGAFKAQLWASGLNTPILELNLMKSVFSNFRICTRFSITGSKYYGDIMYKCQNLYSVFHQYSVMYLLNSYFRICTQFSITGTQVCNYFLPFRNSEFVLGFLLLVLNNMKFLYMYSTQYTCLSLYSVFHLWYSVMKLVHSDFIICSQFSIIVLSYEIIRFRLQICTWFKSTHTWLLCNYYPIDSRICTRFFITLTLIGNYNIQI